MALDSFSGLKGEVSDYLDNPQWFTDRANSFVTLFEAKLNRTLRVGAQQATVTLTPVSGAAALPTDFLELVRLTWTGSTRRNLRYVEPGYLQAAYPDGDSGEPSHYTIEGGNVIVRPVSDTDLELVYYQKIPALSDTNTSNWVLAAYPDLYLWGVLTEAYAFRGDAEKAAVFNDRASAAVAELAALDRLRRSPSSIQVLGPTP